MRDSVQIISAVRKIGWKVDMIGQAASYDEVVATVPGGVTEGFYSMTPMLFVGRRPDHAAVEGVRGRLSRRNTARSRTSPPRSATPARRSSCRR